MKEMNLEIPVICGDAIDGDAVLKSEYAEEISYTISKINSPKEFTARINNLPRYENLKPNIAAATSYDAARVLFSAIEKDGTDHKKLRDEIARTSFKGLSSPVIEFDENGDLKNANFETKIIKNKEAIVRIFLKNSQESPLKIHLKI